MGKGVWEWDWEKEREGTRTDHDRPPGCLGLGHYQTAVLDVEDDDISENIIEARATGYHAVSQAHHSFQTRKKLAYISIDWIKIRRWGKRYQALHLKTRQIV